ncbi:uncharacterized protein [Nicotiana tomentosiformis]|uniref:uncharacterized protein n=1 Tax=Nicotiana tomentosiformis TaxID=4098 RepID=UPI00388C8DF7
MKAQALADHLAENPVDEEYEPLKTYFPDEEVMYVDEVDLDEKLGWKLFFDGAANMKGVEIGAVLISETGQHYPLIAQLRFYCTNNMAEYEACILESRKHIPRIHNEIADALATLASMLHHPDKTYVDPLYIQVRDQHTYCNVVEVETDGEPWFHNIKEYIKSRVYPVHATGDQKRTIRRLASEFFLSGGILYKRTPDLGLLRCIDAKEASTLMTEVHSGVCGPHMNKNVLAKKILRAGYYWLTMERDCIRFVRKCHQCQVHSDLIHSPPSELHTMSAPWPFVAWGIDVIGPIEPVASKGHRFILVAIDYFTKWVEALPFALLGYRTTVRTSVGATPYLLVYGTEAVIPAEVEIPSLRIVAEAEIDDDEWVKTRLEQLSLIDEKRLAAVCHGQLYQKRMARAYNKKVRPRKFEMGQLVLKRILPHQAEAKGKFFPNWQRPFIVTKVLPNGALYLTDIEGKCVDMAINSDVVKRDMKFGHSLGSSMRKVWFRGKEFCSVCRDPLGREHGSGFMFSGLSWIMGLVFKFSGLSWIMGFRFYVLRMLLDNGISFQVLSTLLDNGI